MADDHATRDELDQLQDRLTRQEAQIAALLAERRPRPRHRFPRRFLPLALVALLVLLTPLSLLAASPFNDLTGSVHDPNIGLIYDAGITKGCVPNVSYCPTANVTREEMASFLARTAGLGTNPPVVNAKTAQTATSATTAAHAASADTATNATNAVNAQTATTATNATNATNAALLDGRSANQFSRVARAIVANDAGATPPQPAFNVTAAYPTFQLVTTVTISAPTAGFILVSASGIAQTRNSHSVLLRLRDTTSGETSPYVGQQDSSSSGSLLTTTLTPTYLFPVAAGTQVVALDASGNFTSATSYDHQLQNTILTALFVPFAQDGGTTLAP